MPITACPSSESSHIASPSARSSAAPPARADGLPDPNGSPASGSDIDGAPGALAAIGLSRGWVNAFLAGTLIAVGVAAVSWTRLHEITAQPDPATASRQATRLRAAEGDPAALIELLRLRIDDSAMPRSVAARLETLYWAERSWHLDDGPTRRRLWTFVERECRDPAIDWHWMCRQGE